jgi:hypothetical protein
MATFLTMRDSIKNFCSRNDKFVSPIAKFVLALVMFGSITHLTGYNETLGSVAIVLAAAFVCAFLSEAITLALGGLMACVQIASANTELGITFIIIFVIMYCVYIRFFPKASWVIMFMPFFYMIGFPYFMPILAGMLIGAAGMVPAAFGCVFYYFMKYTGDYIQLSTNTESDDLVEGYKYIFQNLVQDKTLVLTIVVFAVVIVLTHIIYRMSFAYSWYVAIVTGGLVEIVLFMVGGISMDVDLSMVGVMLGSVLAIIVGIVVQFFKTVVDYSRVENTQFEDDDYYYYVKAVPKLQTGNKNKNRVASQPGTTARRESAAVRNEAPVDRTAR